MPIIPHKERLLFAIISCPICEKYYHRIPQANEISCAVNHPPGSCCHYTDKELSSNTVSILMQIAHDPPKEPDVDEKTVKKKKKK